DYCLLTHPDIAIILNIDDRNCGAKHEDAAHDNRIDRFVIIYTMDDRTPEDSIDDLGEGDKEIEDAHVDSHFSGRNAASQDSIRHGKNTGTSNAYPNHAKDQGVRIFSKKDRDQTDSTTKQ